jgi:histidyl-tRNA synthetase
MPGNTKDVMEDKYARNDLSVEQTGYFRKVEAAFLNRCRQFGYREVKTATIEPRYIFTAEGVLAPEMLDRAYSFLGEWDGWSGEKVALRPDSSTCVARFYNQHFRTRGQTPEKKLCYVDNHFVLTDDRDAISERWQCGVENIGAPAPSADIEVIFMAHDMLSEMVGEKFSLYLSCPSAVKKLISALSLDTGPLVQAMKLSPDHVKQVLEPLDDGEKLLNLLTLRGESAAFVQAIADSLNRKRFSEILPVLSNFTEICRMLEQLSCPFYIDMSDLGELDYYTGVRFVFTSGESPRSKARILCAGGRYDHLIDNMYHNMYLNPGDGPDPAPAYSTGFALYVKNIVEQMGKIGQDRGSEGEIRIDVPFITRSNLHTAQRLWKQFTDHGFNVRIHLSPKTGESREDLMMRIEVDTERHGDFAVTFGRNIDKTLLTQLLK